MELPGHHAQKQARALVERPGLLAGTGQRSNTHGNLLLYMRVCRCSEWLHVPSYEPASKKVRERWPLCANLMHREAGGACRGGGAAVRWSATPGQCNPAAPKAQA